MQATLSAEFFTLLATFGGFLIEQNRFPGRAAPVTERLDRHPIFIQAALNAQGFA